MVKMVEVTEAGGAMLGKENDEKIQVNADNINKIEDTCQDDVGTSKIVFNNGTTVFVTESKQELNTIINA
jgi:hypothetical protein